MWRWTFKSLISEPLSFILTALVVGAALVLVIFFEAVFAGEAGKIIAYPEHKHPDVWVMQHGVENMHMATSFIYDWKRTKVAAVEGVAKVTPILYLNTIIEAGDKEWFSFVVGVEPDGKRAGPWKMAAGKPVPGSGEAVIPALLAEMANIHMGDQIHISGRIFTVTGLSEGTFSMANSVTFISYSDLKDIMSLSGSDSYLLVDGKPGVDASTLARRIREQVDNVNAVPSKTFMENDRRMAMQMGVELIRIMTVIGAVLAVLLVAFMLYVFTARKKRDLAVMKALGVTNGLIYTSVLIQALCIASAGLAVAVILAYASVPLTEALVPQVSILITGPVLTRIAVVTLAVSLAASIMPVRQVLNIDPLMVFQR